MRSGSRAKSSSWRRCSRARLPQPPQPPGPEAKPTLCWWESRNTKSRSCRCNSPTPTPVSSASSYRVRGAVEVPGSKNAFILTYDTDPQDLKSTALPMTELQSLFEEQLNKVGRVLLFVDVCKAGTIGTIHNTSVSANVQQLGDVEGDLFGLLASRPKEVSLEGPQFGGGHGVFSYYVIKGLEGAADENHDGVVDADELIKYVSDQVPMATANKQHPREFGTYDNMMRLSDTKKPGIDVARNDFAHWRVILDSRNGGPLYLAGAPQGQVPARQNPADTDRLTSAIDAGRILPSDP